MPHSIALVGSLPLANAREVFDASARYLGDRLKRYPDGETGARANWIGWQRKAFEAVEQLEPTQTREREYQLTPPFKLRDGARAENIHFPDLGFACEALAAWRIFASHIQSGVIAPNARLLVALPTAWAPVYSFTAYSAQIAVHARYEAVLLAEVAKITATVPSESLAIQWDVATEMSWWERLYPAPFEDVEHSVIESVARLGNAVPEGVELGIHLCYGSMNNHHWKEPADTRNLAAVANGLFAASARRIDFLHLPVPQDRDDDAYFAPLDHLRLPDTCELFLGLLHLSDGIAGAKRRMQAASRHIKRYGIACECGLGRHSPESIPDWLQLHADAAKLASA
ncbi:MAG: hypothetical protein EXR28_03340 [Betaproteobacteria bacterium]|nr:hypothetical protein [Betaproteobacteria bacterium]